MGGDDERIDPAAILRSIDEDSARTRKALAPNPGVLNAIWGIAWIVGFTGFYLAAVPTQQPVIPWGLAAVIGAAALAAAITLSTVHSVRRTAGSRGPSNVQSAILGNSFAVAFAMAGLLGWRLAGTGASPDVLLSYWVAVPCLVLGVLSFAGAAMTNDRFQLVFGAWVLIAGLVSIALPPPHNLLAGVLGGFGFLAMAAVAAARPALISGPISRTADG